MNLDTYILCLILFFIKFGKNVLYKIMTNQNNNNNNIYL